MVRAGSGGWSEQGWEEDGVLEGSEREDLRDDAGGEGEGGRQSCLRKTRKKM